MKLNVAEGGVTVNSGAGIAGDVLAPAGTVIVNGSINGYVRADRIVVNGTGRVFRSTPQRRVGFVRDAVPDEWCQQRYRASDVATT